MHIRFLLGAAGTGKTFRCLDEIRTALKADPAGPPLVLLAPKQATFQLERQLLADPDLPGFTRLEILSFERLAEFVFKKLGEPPPALLSEAGRVMVLRAILSQYRDELKIFRASAPSAGFAQKLSGVLRELHNYGLTAQLLEELALRLGRSGRTRLSEKIHDLRVVSVAYRDWLAGRSLRDADVLLELAADSAVGAFPPGGHAPARESKLHLAGLWMDGFAQMTPLERALLRSLLPHCAGATLAFCLDNHSTTDVAWHSPWALVNDTYLQCRADTEAIHGAEVSVEMLTRDPQHNRFAGAPLLQRVEQTWARGRVHADPSGSIHGERGEPAMRAEADGVASAVQIVVCANPEAEAAFVAREIWRFVRGGGRFREAAVLVRRLDNYHQPLRRVFSRYGIPFFVDRREPVAHHPLADLTRHALRTVAFGWKDADWFGALKSGLMPVPQDEIDVLENEALKRGWAGTSWLSELHVTNDEQLGARVEKLRRQLTAPFVALASALRHGPSGKELAEALRRFWRELKVADRLGDWSTVAADEAEPELAATHLTVWDQMQEWLQTLELAFADQRKSLAEWLTILDAGLAGLTVGIIPPVLDQVLVGSIDRSRNPDLRRAFILGVNETIFPAIPPLPDLLSTADRAELRAAGCAVGPDQLLQLGHERFYGYIACTRARENVTLTYAQRDAEGVPLNPSPFVSHLQRLLPGLQVEPWSGPAGWTEAEHPSELLPALLAGNRASPSDPAPDALVRSEIGAWPVLAPILARWRHLDENVDVILPPALAEELYGKVLHTSVSRFEQFASCPFRFFINSGLMAQERERFELDVRQQGTLQHRVLSQFHENLTAQGQRWRDVTPETAREMIGAIMEQLIPQFENGLLEASEKNRFLARNYKESLQQFIAVLVAWFQQYEFNPHTVETSFGMKDSVLPPWEIDLGQGHKLAFRGQVDRIDLYRQPGTSEALCVVIDYKSRLRKCDPLLMQHGVQQQLPAYLSFLRRLRDPRPVFGVDKLIPAGAFYVDFRGQVSAASNRNEVVGEESDDSVATYQHQGIFDFEFLRKLDNRPDVMKGDQFNYSLKINRELNKKSTSGKTRTEFLQMLDEMERIIADMGRRLYAGDVRIDPYRHRQELPCDTCTYTSICRIDAWTHRYRVLRKGRAEEEECS